MESKHTSDVVYTTECHLCGERVKLHPATVKQAYDRGYDADYDGEYLIGTCHKRQHSDGTRTHYGYPTTIVYNEDADRT